MRLIDIILSLFGLILLSPVFLFIIVFGFIDSGSPLFKQRRVGKNKRPFVLLKFRTMKLNTPSVASHLANKASITRFGSFLRRSKLDELPQLWNVLKGEMSLVGPRPCLYNQEELIEERSKHDIFRVKPGITGLAQLRKIDMSTPVLLATTEAEMLASYNLRDYFFYIFRTAIGGGSGDAVEKRLKD